MYLHEADYKTAVICAASLKVNAELENLHFKMIDIAIASDIINACTMALFEGLRGNAMLKESYIGANALSGVLCGSFTINLIRQYYFWHTR